MERTNQCPECSNTYSTKSQDCPECKITLIDRSKATNQTLHGGTDNVAIQGNNNHTVVTKVEQHGSHNETVDYQIDITHTYPNEISLYKKPIAFGGLLLIDGFAFFSDISSIAEKFGLTIDNFPAKTWIIVIAAILIVLSKHAFDVINKLRNTAGSYYHQNADGKVYIVKAKAKCIIKGCSGTVFPVNPQESNQLSETMGVCSNHPNRHIFEFNIDTQKGVRVEPASI